MTLEVIVNSVMQHLDSGGLSVPVFYDNVALEGDDPPNTDHYRAYVLPSSTATLGLFSLSQEIGIIQVSVFVKKDTGSVIRAQLADDIIALFPRNLQLTGLRIDRAGSVAPSLLDGAWSIAPVSITYQNLLGL